MARTVDPKKRRLARILYFGISVAIAAGIVFMLMKETEKLSGGFISARELEKNVGQDPYHYVVIDVRTPEQYAAGHIPFSMNVPKDDIQRQLRFLQPLMERQVVVSCGADAQSCGDAVVILRRAGFQSVLFVEGGFPAWQQAGLPISTTDDSPFGRLVP